MRRESWFTRLRGSFFGIFIGLGLIVTSFPLLFMNEGRSVQTARSLDEGAAVVRHVPASPVQAIHEGKLVHFNGPAVTRGPLRDPDLGVEVKALKLVRKVEMYQWEERHRNRTGTEDPRNYDYERTWSEQARPSGAFRNPASHVNPVGLPYPALTLAASDVSVGDFQVTQRFIAGMRDRPTPLLMDERTLASAPRGGYSSASGGPGSGRPRLDGGSLYYGADPWSPQVGDVRVSFTTVGLSDLSVIGKQSGNGVEPYRTRAGRYLEMAEAGLLGPEEMFDGAIRTNTAQTWFLRFLGFVEMALGLTLTFKPTVVVGQLVPLAGSLLDTGTAILAFGVAGVCSLVTIAVAWFVYRPLLSVVLLVLGAGVGWTVMVMRRKGPAGVMPPPPPFPPMSTPFAPPPPTPFPLPPPIVRQPPPMP